MTDWGAFAGFAGVVVLLFLLLARASQSMLPQSGPAATSTGLPGVPTAPPGEASGDRCEQAASDDRRPGQTEPPASGERPSTTAERPLADTQSLSTGELLANVLVTQGVFGGLLAAAAVFWAVPASALGIGPPTVAAVGGGVVVGVGLYVADEVGATWADRVGVDHDETLRGLLAPESAGGWLVLLGLVLPVIALSEEFIFRAVLVGALATGFDLPVWGLAVASSAAFALGHGAQGRGGVLVTGVLGFVLAAAFVLSGSFLLVVVAHYVVNALEFAVHEGLDVEWTDGIGPE